VVVCFGSALLSRGGRFDWGEGAAIACLLCVRCRILRGLGMGVLVSENTQSPSMCLSLVTFAIRNEKSFYESTTFSSIILQSALIAQW
jgi:hypothetical protein